MQFTHLSVLNDPANKHLSDLKDPALKHMHETEHIIF
jgi:hypothetical protein